MKDENKTKKQLIQDLIELRQRIAELEALQVEPTPAHLELNTQAYGQAVTAEREQRELSEALREAGAALSATLDFEVVLDRLLDQIARVVAYDAANVMLVEDRYTHVVRMRGYEQFGKEIARQVAAQSLNIDTTANLRRMVETNEPLVISDTVADPDWVRSEASAHIRSWAGTPILVQDEVIAFFALDKVEPGFYQPEDAERLAAFAGQAAIAIQNARLFKQTQAALAETATLLRVSQTLAQVDDEQEMFELVLQECLRYLELRQGGVLIIDDDKMHGTLLAHMVDGKLVEAGLRIPVSGNPSYERLMDTKETLVIKDALHDKLMEPVRELNIELGIKSILLVPIVVRGEVIGSLGADDTHTIHEFTNREISLVEAMANQLGIAIENIRLQAETQRRALQLTVLLELDRAITASLRLDDILHAFARHISRLLPYNRMSIALLENDNLQVTYVATEGEEQRELDQVSPAGTVLSRHLSAVGWVIERGQPLLRHNISTESRFAEDKQLIASGIRSSMNIPLRVKGQVIGTWNIGNRQMGAYGPEDLEIAQSMADQLAVVIDNARLFEQAQQEIRERQQAEQALRASEERFRRAISSISDHIYMTEVSEDTKKINRYLSPNIEQLTGYPVERFMADWHFWALSVIHPDDRNVAAAQAAQLVKGHDSEVEYRLVRADGEIIWVRDSARVEHAGDSKIIYGVVSDITTRKQAEAELNAYRESLETLVLERTTELEQAMAETAAARDRIDAILHSVADGLIVTDLEHRVILANPAAEDLLGFRLEEMLGQEIGRGIKDDRLREIVRNTLDQRTTGYEIDIELEDPHRHRPRVLRTRTALVDDQYGQPLGTVTIMQDVTRLREVDRLKTEFLTAAAHELRTPLTSILGFGEILLTRELDVVRHQNYMRLIYEQSTHLSKIVDDLLDVSRLEAGRGLDLKLEPVDLASLMKEVVMPFVETATKHEIKVDWLRELPFAKGDPFRLAQVGRNLLSNATKYSPEGGKITISGREIPGFIEISFTDEGVGMTPEQQERLFEPFYRVDPSPNAVSGTGLGLTISKLIIERHGGEIWVKSKQGVGTTVYFTLPIAEN